MEGEIIPPDRRLPVPESKGALVPVGGSVPAVAGDGAGKKAGKKAGRKKASAPPPVSNSETMAKGYVERLVRLMNERAELNQAIADVKAEAKSAGFSPKAIMVVVSRQLETLEEKQKREAVETEAEQIMAALGMLADTPLGQAAARTN